MHWRPIKFPKRIITTSHNFKRQHQVLFFQELGELLQSGYSIAHSLDILAAAHTPWTTWLATVNARLNQGVPLHVVLDQTVSQAVLLQIKLADQHGNLSETLVTIGRHLAQVQQQQQKIKQVLQYPIVLIGLLGLMLIGMKLFLYPILQQWQDTAVLDSGETQQVMWYVIGMIVVALCFGIWHWRRLPARQRLKMLSRLWLIGPIVKTIVTYQVAQQLAVLLANGLTVPEILAEMCGIQGQKNQQLAILLAEDAHIALQSGCTLSEYILKQPYFNQALAGYFVRGHEPKRLAGYLAYYAKLQYHQVMQRTNRLIDMLQPIFFGVIGIAIIAVYLSMLLPMYQTIGGLYQ